MEDNKGIFILAGVLMLFSILGFYKYISNNSLKNSKAIYTLYGIDKKSDSNKNTTTNYYNSTSYKEARKSTAKSSAIGYVESIENYIGFYEAKAGGISGLEGYDVEAPLSTVTCIKSMNYWSGEGCQDFYTAVDQKTKGRLPDSATIIIENGKVKLGSKLSYNGFECTYSESYPYNTMNCK